MNDTIRFLNDVVSQKTRDALDMGMEPQQVLETLIVSTVETVSELFGTDEGARLIVASVALCAVLSELHQAGIPAVLMWNAEELLNVADLLTEEGMGLHDV